MTDPEDFYPWPREPVLYIKALLTLLSSYAGRESLQKELTTGIAKYLRANREYCSRRLVVRMPGVSVAKTGDDDPNAREILKIYIYLREAQSYYVVDAGLGIPTIRRRNLGIYYLAYRQALSQLRAEDKKVSI